MRVFDQRGPLGGLGGPAERDLLSLGRARNFGRDDSLPVFSGPSASHAVLLVTGFVKVSASVGGHEVTLDLRGPGDLMGEYAVLRELRKERYQPPRASQELRTPATALTPVEAKVIPIGTLCRFLRSHPDALAAVALSTCERLEEAETRLASAEVKANERLARLLCDLERHGKPQHTAAGLVGGTEIPLKLSQADIAGLIGTGRDTVQRTLRDWSGRGIVSTKYRTIVVHDLAALARIAHIQVSRRTYNWPEMPEPSARPPARQPSRRVGAGLGALIPDQPARMTAVSRSPLRARMGTAHRMGL